MRATEHLAETERRIIVVSDLHMTAGRNPATGAWSPTEDFFQDDEFARFLKYLGSGPATTLVINGDLFDFLQVLEFPDEWKKDRGKNMLKDHVYDVQYTWHGRPFHYNIPLADINATYGLRCTEEATRFLMGRIVEGHEQFFQALVDFVGREGNSVMILKGNHDIQLFWDGVQNELYERLECLAPPGLAPLLRERIAFKPWFYYEPGLIWIEHGNQYEYTTSFVNFLVPTLPFAYDETGASKQAGASTSPEAAQHPVDDRHIELDLSSFLVRYLTNPSEPVNPLADNIRPLTRYWEGIWRDHPFFVLGTFRAGLIFMLKAFAKSAQMRRKTGRSDREISPDNRNAMMAESQSSGLPLESLMKLDNCKAEPTMAHGPLRVLWWFLKPALTGALWLLPLVIITASVTTWIPDPPETAGWLERMGITVLQGAIIIAAGALLVGTRQFYRKLRAAFARTKAQHARETAGAAARSGPALKAPPLTGATHSDMRTIATYISVLLDVRFVTFGHTHYADIHAIEHEGAGNGRWYFNTGTWMSIFEPREQLYREARQLTFLEVAVTPGNEPAARLLCWYPPQSEPRPVVVVDMEELDDGVENGIVMGVLKRFA